MKINIGDKFSEQSICALITDAVMLCDGSLIELLSRRGEDLGSKFQLAPRWLMNEIRL